MSIEKVRKFLKTHNKDKEILEFDVSSATVPLAAIALKTQEARIAKSMALDVKGDYIVVVVAGDAKIDNHKFKDFFQAKAKMLSIEQTAEITGHAVGGVCPFALPENVHVYLDVSMQRFNTIYPACGSSNSAIELTCNELEKLSSNFVSWVDVCKDWSEVV